MPNKKDHNHSIFAIIPAYNEEKNLARVVNGTKAYVDHIIIVNDCSTDNTQQVAETLNVECIELKENKGAGYATRVGCERAIAMGADYLITLDSDGQHAASDIPGIVNCLLEEDVDIVFGYREKDSSMPLIKQFGNTLLSLVSRILYGVKLKDALTGFHGFKAKSFSRITWKSDRYGFIQEFVYNVYMNKLKYAEVNVETIYLDQKIGMRKRDGIKSLFLLFYWRIKAIFL